MDNFIKHTEEKTNKNGKVIQKTITLQPKNKNGKISLSDTDVLYKKLRDKYKKEGKKFSIRVMTYDGIKTLNGFSYDEESLKFCFEDYYNNLPADVQEKFKHFFFVQVIVA
jgi:hypothetical protein